MTFLCSGLATFAIYYYNYSVVLARDVVDTVVCTLIAGMGWETWDTTLSEGTIFMVHTDELLTFLSVKRLAGETIINPASTHAQ